MRETLERKKPCKERNLAKRETLQREKPCIDIHVKRSLLKEKAPNPGKGSFFYAIATSMNCKP
jgi:hypothetical protein